MGGHKGRGLATIVDFLCCVLSGVNWGPWAPPFALRQEIPSSSVGKGIGHLFTAVRIDALIDSDEFKSQFDVWIQTFQATVRYQWRVDSSRFLAITCDPEREAEGIRSQDGIPLVMPVVEDLPDISQTTGIAYDQFISDALFSL